MKKRKKKKKVAQKQKPIELKYYDPKDLKPWDGNPRKNDQAVDRLAGLLNHYGFISPIIATRDLTVRAGHTRLKAAIKSGMKNVPVILIDLDEKKAQAFSIAENKSHEWTKWDEDMLIKAFAAQGKQVSVEDLAAGTGFSSGEIEAVRAATMFSGMAGQETEEESEAGPKEGRIDHKTIILTGNPELIEKLSRLLKTKAKDSESLAQTIYRLLTGGTSNERQRKRKRKKKT